MQKIANYINGALVEPTSKQYIDNYNPSTGTVYSLCPDSDERDVELAYQAAEAAFEGWSNTPTEKRSRIIAESIKLEFDFGTYFLLNDNYLLNLCLFFLLI
jgi:aminomuconate-semialdehyde/2-hydroxymuconate-6-semialdehyde dehydrogenase